MKRLPPAGRLAALSICGIAVALSACSASVGSGTKTIDQPDEVTDAQNFVSRQLTDLPPVQSTDCPSDVEAKVGTTFACQATLGNGQKVTVPLRVTSVNGSHGSMSSDPAVVDQALAVDLIYKAANVPAKSVDCPTGIRAKVGKTFDCRANLKDGTTDTVTLRVERAPSNGNQDLRIVGVRKG